MNTNNDPDSESQVVALEVAVVDPESLVRNLDRAPAVDSFWTGSFNATKALFSKATKAVPAVRYAVGVAGVAGAGALCVGYFKQPKGAFVATVVTFVFMAVLFLFGVATRQRDKDYRLPVLVMVWAILLLFLFWCGLLTSSVAGWGPSTLADRLWGPSPGPYLDPTQAQYAEGNKKIVGYKAQVLVVRGDYEARDRNPATRDSVAERAAALARLMHGVDDSQIDLMKQILKYEYGGWASLISARLAIESSPQQRALVDEAQRMLKEAQRRIDVAAAKHAAGDKEGSEIYEYVLGDSADEARVRWLLAVALALEARAFHSRPAADSRKLLDSISPAFKAKYPPEKDDDLRWALNQSRTP